MVLNKALQSHCCRWLRTIEWMPVFRQKLPAQVSGRLRSCTWCQVTFNPEQICCMCCSAVTCFSQALGTGCQEKETDFICMTATRQYPPLTGYFHSWREWSAFKMCWKAPRWSRLWRFAKWEWSLIIFEIRQVHRPHTRTEHFLLGLCGGCFNYFKIFNFICLIVMRFHCIVFVADWLEKVVPDLGYCGMWAETLSRLFCHL